jgi:hypothetical protein
LTDLNRNGFAGRLRDLLLQGPLVPGHMPGILVAPAVGDVLASPFYLIAASGLRRHSPDDEADHC